MTVIARRRGLVDIDLSELLAFRELVHQLTKTEPVGQRGRQEEPGVSHEPVVVKGHIEPVEAVR